MLHTYELQPANWNLFFHRAYVMGWGAINIENYPNIRTKSTLMRIWGMFKGIPSGFILPSKIWWSSTAILYQCGFLQHVSHIVCNLRYAMVPGSQQQTTLEWWSVQEAHGARHVASPCIHDSLRFMQSGCGSNALHCYWLKVALEMWKVCTLLGDSCERMSLVVV